MMKKKGLNTIVLVEGPRDAIRLFRDGIPVAAILGTNNWTNAKRQILEAEEFDRVILLMDGDKAGKKAESELGPDLKKHMPTKIFPLWKVAEKLSEKRGEVVKLDPNNMSDKLVEKLRDNLI